MSLEAQPLPSEFVCPHCQTKLDMHSPITKEAEVRGLHKGMNFVCGHCATFAVLGDTALERMSVAQFKALPEEMKRLMGLARRQIEMRNAKEN